AGMVRRFRQAPLAGRPGLQVHRPDRGRRAIVLRVLLHRHRPARRPHGGRRVPGRDDRLARAARRVLAGLHDTGRGGRDVLELRRCRLDHPLPADLPDREELMPPRLPRLLIAWVILLALLGIEFGASFLPLAPWPRVLILLPALAMAAIVGVVFMEVGRGPVVARGFAVAGLFWLLVLLGLGSMDPLTRTDYHTTVAHPE